MQKGLVLSLLLALSTVLCTCGFIAKFDFVTLYSGILSEQTKVVCFSVFPVCLHESHFLFFIMHLLVSGLELFTGFHAILFPPDPEIISR